ncbi:MAG: HAAS signaling domain-containing protein, partial [Candidatus Dormibacteria bacterium]
GGLVPPPAGRHRRTYLHRRCSTTSRGSPTHASLLLCSWHTEADKLVTSYLAQLGSELRQLPPARRRQILDEVAGHISESRAALQDQDGVSIRSLLDRVGDPDAIAAEAMAGEPRRQTRWGDVLVPWLLLFGGFLFVIGWLLGAGLLWSSSRWRLRDKLLGTLVWPGGLAGIARLGGFASATTSCSSAGTAGQPATVHCATQGFSMPPAIGIAVVIVLLAAPLVVAVHLDRVRRRG